ncbi:MAG: carbamoyl-phosphate synthase large subunit, partial [Proteobacteria bacterium]|nr:carbamoyl-phosphate synthase large subunit [Pseudomonadota bacterium]
MPKRTDISSILIIGAGPIVIGQACEFDYSGTQAVKALKEEGYRIVLVNSNPATIMTDPELADATYIEPITPEIVAKIIEKERPDALLPTMGGQTALNTALKLEEMGVLAKFGVEMIGAKADAIDKAENRERFRQAMTKIGLQTPKSHVVQSLGAAIDVLDDIGLPAIIRPSFTMGGTGGGIAYNKAEFIEICERGLDASPTTEVLVEESVLGWKEFEMEVVRDKADNAIIVCSIENVDPMGVHTGDSITIAPALTLTDKEYQMMRDASIRVLREIGVETGGSNVQFAVNPADGRLVVIEMNPRVSRSSALASKATGFPIAKVAAKLAVGYTLDEIANDITGGATPASFEPSIDYVVTKVPRFAFEKFPGAEPILTTAMKSVGESMAIGRTFAESLQKALRSLETGLSGLNEVEIEGLGKGDDKNAIRAALAKPTPDRLLVVAQALRLGLSHNDIHEACKIDRWFIERLQEIVDLEARVKAHGLPQDAENFRALKAAGFSDVQLAALAGVPDAEVTARRHALDVRPVYKRIDTCAAEFASPTAYMYSSYETPFAGATVCESDPSDRQKIVILGGGPNRIGQGIEFDYCCCHACFALSDAGFETIMVNCNPETVSTDYDTSDRLYFEPLTAEDVLEILAKEQSRGTLKGVIVQFGGQTPLKLADALQKAGIPILGTSVESIDLAEDRDRFKRLLDRLGLKQPKNGIAYSVEQSRLVAAELGLPLVVRPSYVLGGRAMAIIHDQTAFDDYLLDTLPSLVPSEVKARYPNDKTGQINTVLGKNPLLFDRYLSDATEVDVDCLCDGKDVFIAGIMEHIEEAGIHSGDSACAIPAFSLAPAMVDRIRRAAKELALRISKDLLANLGRKIDFAAAAATTGSQQGDTGAQRPEPAFEKRCHHGVAPWGGRLLRTRVGGIQVREARQEGHHGLVHTVMHAGRRVPHGHAGRLAGRRDTGHAGNAVELQSVVVAVDHAQAAQHQRIGGRFRDRLRGQRQAVIHPRFAHQPGDAAAEFQRAELGGGGEVDDGAPGAAGEVVLQVEDDAEAGTVTVARRRVAGVPAASAGPQARHQPQGLPVLGIQRHRHAALHQRGLVGQLRRRHRAGSRRL